MNGPTTPTAGYETGSTIGQQPNTTPKRVTGERGPTSALKATRSTRRKSTASGVKKASRSVSDAEVNESDHRQAQSSMLTAPNVVWAIDFQFDSVYDGGPFKIASMVDEHTRESLRDLTSRSITGQDVVAGIEDVISRRGAKPEILRCDNGPELVS